MHRLLAPLILIATLAACLEGDLDPGIEIARGLVPGPGGPFETTYVVRADGTVVVQGDILIDLAEIEALTWPQRRSATARQRHRQWVGGIIPYTFDSSVSASMRQTISATIAFYNAFTPITFKPWAGHEDFVVFTTPADPDDCSSFVGRLGRDQVINLGANCNAGPIIAHEIGHAAGLWHEQSRRDRDGWVAINTANIEQTADALAQFDKYSDSGGADYGLYDYLSLMHYSELALSRNGLPTMTALQTVPNNRKMGTSSWLTAGDTRGLRSLYDRQTREVEIVYPSHNDKCWDIPNGSHANQAGVQIFPCHDGDNQRWIVQPTGDGHFELRNKKSNKCLDIPGGSTGHVRVQQFDCHGGPNQRWRFHRHGDLMTIRSKNAERCVSLDAELRTLELGSCSFPDGFAVYARPDAGDHFRLRHEPSGQCIDIPGHSASPGTDLQLYPCKEHSGTNQQWAASPVARQRYVQIRSTESMLCLDRADPLRLEQRTCSAALTQQWVLPLTTGGSVQLVPNNVHGYTTCLEIADTNNPHGNWLAAEAGCVSGDPDTYWWIEPNPEGSRLVGVGPGPGG